MYRIYDIRDKVYSRGIYKLRKHASYRADYLDSVYGSVRYIVERVE